MELGKVLEMVKEIRVNSFKEGYNSGYMKGVQDTLDAIDEVLKQKRESEQGPENIADSVAIYGSSM